MTHALALIVSSDRSIADDAAVFYKHFSGTLVQHESVKFAFIDLDGPGLVQQGIEAITQLERLGFTVLRVHRDIVDASEIAARTGLTRQVVQQWATGRQRTGFPAPVAFLGAKRVWEWAAMAAWLRDNVPGLDVQAGLPHELAVAIDAYLCGRLRGGLAAAVDAGEL